MKKINIADIVKMRDFFETVANCRGTVELVTEEGDCLNMKSTLCQYIALTQMFQERQRKDVSIILSDDSDFERIQQYLVIS